MHLARPNEGGVQSAATLRPPGPGAESLSDFWWRPSALDEETSGAKRHAVYLQGLWKTPGDNSHRLPEIVPLSPSHHFGSDKEYRWQYSI